MLNYKNNLRTTLYYKLWSTDTTVSLVHLVTDADEAVRRAAWPAVPFTLTVVNPANNNIEIIKCTADSINSSDYISFVCTRGEEDTAASDFEAGYRVENRVTAKHLTDTSSTLDAVKSVTDTVGVSALSNGIPRADTSGKLGFDWFPSLVYNVKEVITTSGTYTAPVTGWYKIQTVGGGGGGGGYSSTAGGLQGGTTSFGALLSATGGSGGGGGAGGGGGGGAGKTADTFVYLTEGQSVSCVIGAGGVIGTGAPTGPEAGINGIEFLSAGTGAAGASTGGGISSSSNSAPVGGAGGINGTGYGGGGGGAGGNYPTGTFRAGAPGGDGGKYGLSTGTGAGGAGAIIIEYFDPSVTS